MMIRISLLLAAATLATATVRLQERYSWNAIDFNFPDEYSRQKALRSGAFVPENGLPVGIEVWRHKLFVSVPRWRSGIPATLNYIDLTAPYEPSPKLNPYPSWAGNELGNCESGLNTVYRIKADRCGRLWVLDTGTFGIGNTTTNPCPYAINVFDLATDRRIRRYVLRPEDTNANTFIANIAIDIGKTCDDTFAYLSDELGYGLISYSWEKNKSWRFEHSYFMPDPLLGDFNIAGLNFQWGAEGIFGITLSPINKDGYRTFYFSPLASHREFAVSTSILRDESRVEDSYHDFKVMDARASDSHVTSKVMHESGVMLFNLIDQNAIGCWNSALPYKPQNHAVVDKDDVGLVFPSDVKIDANDNVWVISDRMPVFLEADLDYTDINFRIYMAPLNDLIQGTVCEPVQTRFGKITTPAVFEPPTTYVSQITLAQEKPQSTYLTNAGPQLFGRVTVPVYETTPNTITTNGRYYTSAKKQSLTYTVPPRTITNDDLVSQYLTSQTPSSVAAYDHKLDYWPNHYHHHGAGMW